MNGRQQRAGKAVHKVMGHSTLEIPLRHHRWKSCIYNACHVCPSSTGLVSRHRICCFILAATFVPRPKTFVMPKSAAGQRSIPPMMPFHEGVTVH